MSRRPRDTRHGFGTDGYPCLWIHDREAPAAGTHAAYVLDPDGVNVEVVCQAQT